MESDLDLRVDGIIGKQESVRLQKIALKARSSFNDAVSILSDPNISNLDWWAQGPASRNVYASPFFDYYCRIHLVAQLLNSSEFNYQNVLVDSKALKNIIQKLLADHGKAGLCKVRFSVPFSKRIRFFIKKHTQVITFFMVKVLQLVIAKCTKGKKTNDLPTDKTIVLIDTFALPQYISEDRWYGELWTSLSEEMKSETYFVPTVVIKPFKGLLGIYKELRSCERNFILKEDYLKLKDILFAVKHFKRAKKFTIKPLLVCGQDISPLIWEEIWNCRDYLSVIESILIYRFFGRLKENRIKVRLAIDWFEGQILDKAWNLACNTFYPNVKRVGYRPTGAHPFYLSSYPIEIERRAKVIPDVMAIPGKGRFPIVREFLPDLEVVCIPSFRTPHICEYDFTSTDRSKKNDFTILVALPITNMDAVRIFNQLLDAYQLTIASDRIIKYVIKTHPAGGTEKEILALVNREIPNDFCFTNEKSLTTLLRETDLLITIASSACLEASAWGIPVIIVENEYGLTHNPIPDGFNSEMYKSVRGVEQLKQALSFYIGLGIEDIRKQKEYGKVIRDDFFVPITTEGVERFMHIGNDK